MVELPLLEEADLQSLEDLVVFTEEVEQEGTGPVDQAHQAVLLLTAPHQVAPQAHLHTVAAGSIFMRSVRVLFLFA